MGVDVQKLGHYARPSTEDSYPKGATAFTQFAPEGSVADRINKMTNVNHEGSVPGSSVTELKGSPKDTSGGKDLSRNATNSLGKISMKEPTNIKSATCMGAGKK